MTDETLEEPPSAADQRDIRDPGAEPILTILDEAEEVPDPLDGLIGRVKHDAGAAFQTQVLTALGVLKQADRAPFELLWADLKNVGCRVTALDEVMNEQNPGFDRDRPKQADVLISLAEDAALFHTPDKVAYADVMVEGHRETLSVRSKGFRFWLTRQFYQETGGAPNAEALQAALNVIETKALIDGPERQVFVRVAGHADTLYLDLCDTAWRAVEVDGEGWRVINDPPVRFRRSSGMRALPTPLPGGSVEGLRSFLNVASDRDFVPIRPPGTSPSGIPPPSSHAGGRRLLC